MSEDIPMVENYNPRKIVLGKVEEKHVTFFLPDGDNFKKIKFQTPKMRICFDVEERKTKMGKLFVKNVTLSTNEIGSDNNRKRIEILRTKLEKTEKYIKRLLPDYLKNKKFNSSLWQGNNKDFKPTFKVGINFDRNEEANVGIFDKDNNPMEHTKLQKGQIVSMSIKLEKLWIWNDKIGINWNIEQIKVYEELPKKGFRIVKESEDDDDEDYQKPKNKTKKKMLIR